MAPRKRTTKQQKNTRKAKLDAFLGDFDIEVKTRMEQLKEKMNQLLKDCDNSCHMMLLKMPKAVRQTNWLEHGASDKPKTPEVDNSKREEEAATVESVVATDHALLLKSAKTPKKRAAKSTSQDGSTTSTTRKTRTTRKPPTTSKRAKALAANREGSAIRRSSRKPLVTPARSVLDSSLMGATPLVTPRFDPRLPKTPAVRVPRHKERVYSISVNGSPIAARSDDIVINVPVGNGESIQLLAGQMDSVDLSLLSEKALQSIRKLQTDLSSLCGTSQ